MQQMYLVKVLDHYNGVLYLEVRYVSKRRTVEMSGYLNYSTIVVIMLFNVYTNVIKRLHRLP